MTIKKKMKIIWVDSDRSEHSVIKQLAEKSDWCDLLIVDTYVTVQKMLRYEPIDGIVSTLILSDAKAYEIIDHKSGVPTVVVYRPEDATEAYKIVDAGAVGVVAADDGPYILTALSLIRNACLTRYTVKKQLLFNEILTRMLDAVCVTELDNTVIYVNHAFCSMFGCSEDDILGKKSYLVHDGIERVDEPEETYIGYHTRNDGGGFYFALYGSLLHDTLLKQDKRVWIVKDVTEQKEQENNIRMLSAEIERSVTIDAVTGLYNRRYFMEQLTRELVRANRYSTPLALLLVDIDSFKTINDVYGHIVGDHVLTMVSDTISEAIRVSDITGRLGSNAFGIILPQTPLCDAAKLAESVRMEIMEDVHFGIDMNVFNVTCSVGLVELHAAMERTNDLMNAADKALKEAKSRGKNCVVAAEFEVDKELSFTAYTDDCDR